MQDFHSFDYVHFDVLKELGNIGAGHAVTSLSKLLGRKVDMSVPVVNLVDFKDISDFIGGPESLVVGILVNISGDINGIMMFLVKRESARVLLNILMGGQPEDNVEVMDFSEMELSALTEVGNILASSYLGSLAGLINKVLIPSVPSLGIDMANAILSVPAIEFGKVADQVLFIESVFKTETDNASGYFLLVPDLPSFQLILSSLGVM